MFLPASYITIVDAIEAELCFFSAVDAERQHEESIYSFGVALAGGSLQSFGWDFESGEVLPLPRSIWFNQGSLALMRRMPHKISFEPKQKRRTVIPIIEISSLMERYQPAELFVSCLPEFRAADWSLHFEDAANATPSISKNNGGRPREYDWEQYWIQAVLLADLHGLGEDDEGWSNFHRDLDKWVIEVWDKQPDESVLRRKKAQLKKALEARRHSARK